MLSLHYLFHKSPYRYIALLTLGLLMLMLGRAAAQSQPSFTVGVVAAPESDLARGATLRARQINADGGVQGADGTRYRLDLLYTPVTAETPVDTVATTLTQNGVIAIIGPETTTEINDYLPTLQTVGVPILTSATGVNVLLSDTSGLVFRVRAADFVIERGLAEYLVQEAGATNLQLYQFDADSTEKALTFQTAAQDFGANVAPAQIVFRTEEIATAINAITAAPPEAVVTYGNPATAREFLQQLRAAGYTGLFAHNQPTDPVFSGDLPPDALTNIVSANAWAFTATDRASADFTLAYLRAYRQIPEPIAAAGADAVALIQAAIARPGELQANLRSLEGILGVQGLLSPVSLSPGETSDNVLVLRSGDDGVFRTAIRFVGNERLEDPESDAPLLTPTPTPTATPAGVVATILSGVQNVRTGPSTDFPVIGQLEEGEQVQVIGANNDFTWLVIEFRGQQAWIANLQTLNEIFGDLDTVPLVVPPPTPTPVATRTPSPTTAPQVADIQIQAAAVSPNPIRPGQSFNVSVTVRNVGNTDAGSFAVAATFQPGNVFTSSSIGSLAAGSTTTVTLSGTLSNTGNYSTVIVADLNDQVREGNGENNNNDFSLSYRVDKEISTSGNTARTDAGTLDLGNGVTVDWDGAGNLNAASGQIGVLAGASLSNTHADLINSGVANQAALAVSSGQVIAILNPDNRKGVFRIDNINGDDISITYRTYAP